jgi:cell division protein FtsQ
MPAASLENARFRLLKRRLQRYLPRRPVRFAGYAAGAALTAVAVVAAADLLGQSSRLRSGLFAATARLGFAVEDVEVLGREMTAPEDILKALEAGRGTPILGVSPSKARQQLELLPWVRSASVERRLPDTLFVRLTERKPLALWQRHGKMVLIDRDGVVVATEHLERYANLLLVVGEDAPKHAEELIGVLETEPQLMKRVTAAVRVGDRRWNLQLDNGIDVELPENNVGAAWAHLAEIEREHALFARNIEKVDLRLADRVVVKVVAEPRPAPPPKRGKTAAKST